MKGIDSSTLLKGPFVPLYLSNLEFSNIRGFKNFSLSFDAGKKYRQWTIFIGDNGHGKTTILRAIAVGLGDEVTSSELLALLPGQFIRMNKKGVYAPSSEGGGYTSDAADDTLQV
nr:AAA family ATPase [Herbaspirillum sp. ASV7]